MPAIANVNWAPPFQGPFVVNRGTSDYGREITSYHRAAKAFQAIISAPENQFTHMLRPGHCVIFNNRRILHGREQFNSVGVQAGKERWLKGAYLDMDDVSSTLRKVAGDHWVLHEMRRIWAAAENKKSESEQTANVQGHESGESLKGREDAVSQHNDTATQKSGDVLGQQSIAAASTMVEPIIKELTPRIEQMMEQWWQSKTQRAEHGTQIAQAEPLLQEEPQEPTRQVNPVEQQIPESEPTLQDTQIMEKEQEYQSEQDDEELDEELALHGRRAAQRLQDYEGESSTLQQQPIIHAFADAQEIGTASVNTNHSADEQDMDLETAKDSEGKPEDAAGPMNSEAPSWRNGGQIAAAEEAFRSEQGSPYSRYR